MTRPQKAIPPIRIFEKSEIEAAAGLFPGHEPGVMQLFGFVNSAISRTSTRPNDRVPRALAGKVVWQAMTVFGTGQSVVEMDGQSPRVRLPPESAAANEPDAALGRSVLVELLGNPWIGEAVGRALETGDRAVSGGRGCVGPMTPSRVVALDLRGGLSPGTRAA